MPKLNTFLLACSGADFLHLREAFISLCLGLFSALSLACEAFLTMQLRHHFSQVLAVRLHDLRDPVVVARQLG